jgi:hypothetical protein
MAGDGRVTAGSSLMADDFAKVRRMKDGSVVGMCGDLRDIELAFDWLAKGASFDVIPKFVGKPGDGENGFEALVLRPDGKVEVFDQACVFVPYSPPYAIGCGADVALTCLTLGMTPRQAVEHTATLNVKVGGKTTCLKPKRKD